MSKTQTLIWAIVCIGGAIFWFMVNLAILGAFCLMVAAVFGLWTAFQRIRDYGLAHAVEAAQDTSELTPPMTSPGSKRLFVPQPLDKR
jgi:hypothetical protein